MRINWLNLWTGSSAVLLVGANSAVTIMALAWAIAGLLGLAPQLGIVLYGLGAVLSLAVTVGFARIAHEAEPFFERKLSAHQAHAGAFARHDER